MSSSSSEDDEKPNFAYWNNWQPIVKEAPKILKNEVTKVTFCEKEKAKPLWAADSMDKFGNWIPPASFSKNEKPVLKRIILRKTRETKKNHEFNSSDVNVSFDESVAIDDSKTCDRVNNWEKVLNCDWGERVELHDVSRFSDGDLIWGIVSLGFFAHIKLWINEYGNICGLAEGKISKEGSSDSSMICITNIDLIRKMLNLSTPQWASLTEVIEQEKLTLKFEALSRKNILELPPLQKLWLYICKRRHFLADQCMLVKFDGAVKSLKDFKIIPKLIVQEIRDLSGQTIL